MDYPFERVRMGFWRAFLSVNVDAAREFASFDSPQLH